MLWVGRCDAGARWTSSSVRLVREVLEQLVSRALPSSTFFADRTLAAWPAAQGRWATVTLSALERGAITSPIDWADSAPPADALAAGHVREPLPFLRVDVQSRAGRSVAGVLLVTDGIYTRADVQRAIEASFDGGDARPGRYCVLASASRPAPRLRHYRGERGLAVYRCDNPGCPSRGAEVLVPGSPGQHAQHSLDAVAFACPSCYGSWQYRWALTWVRPSRDTDLRTAQVVEYPVRPTQRRRVHFAGPMQIVVSAPRAAAWVGWSGIAVPRLPAKLKRFLLTRRPRELLSALVDDPVLVGSLLPGLLSPDNLRELVDFIRRLPIPRRFGGVATGLAHGFSPRRATNYATEQDEIQASHHQYIAYDPEAFLERMSAYGCLDLPGRFLDVGCGIGEKLFLAFALGAFTQCDGIEYDARTAAVADFLFDRIAPRKRYPVQIVRGDSLDFDRYGDYDVIYMFRPMWQSESMNRLVRRIAAQLKPGAIMFDVLRDGFALKKEADNQLVTVGPLPADGRAAWDVPVTIDEFLKRMGIA